MTDIQKYRQMIGRKGEDAAAAYLKRKGYQILERNFRMEGEIDIIAKDRDTLVFVEVKTNYHGGYGEPEGRVDKRKQTQMIKAATGYLQKNRLDDMDCRFDVVGIVHQHGKMTFRHIEDAFWVDA